jgi:homoserine dehydrogenase
MTPQQQLEIDPRPALHELPNSARGSHRNKNAPTITYHPESIPNASVETPRTVRLALAGCGVVGGGLVRLLHESAPAIAARFGVRFDLTSVLVRDVTRERNLPLEARLFTNNLDGFLSHDADVVVEAVGGDEPARTIASDALRRGKKVITANKELVASHGETLSALAVENRTGLDFGAAVRGSAPVISTLRDLVGASTPLSVRGILNGTSNYVISLLERGESLEAAITSARKRGLAEADCSRDLDGRDAADKLAIIAWITFGIQPTGLHVRRTSLVPGLERLVRVARTEGARVRLIAECTQLPGRSVVAAVQPVIVACQSAFGRTTLEENRVEVDLGWASPLSVSGPGAGGGPTAAALLSDLLRVSPPPNDRGAGATLFVSATADPREHRWLESARIDSASLKHAVTEAGLGAERFIGEHADSAVITTPTTWDSVERLIAALELVNATPCIARYEPAKQAEVLQ